jgi:hypothetical protein
MNRSELLRSVSALLGMPVKYHHLVHAQKIGVVSKTDVVGGWQKFGDDHIKQLASYMKDHARTPMMKMGENL